MNVFEFKEYRVFLKEMVQLNSERRGYLAKLAEAAGCQRSYLTLVLKGETNFTPEHAFGITQFWGLSEIESDYFMDLVSIERTSSGPLKTRLLKRMDQQRREQSNFNKRYDQTSLSDIEKEALYYSQWNTGAVHVSLSIPRLQTAETIAQRLQLPLQEVQVSLQILRNLGLIHLSGGKWTLKNKSIHLPRYSLFNSLNHQNWRAKAVIDSQKASSQGVHYTAIQSVSRSDFEKIHGLLLKFIDQQRKIVTGSPEEDLAVFCCDWFNL